MCLYLYIVWTKRISRKCQTQCYLAMREYFENEEYNAWWIDGLMDLLVGADFATALRIVQCSMAQTLPYAG